MALNQDIVGQRYTLRAGAPMPILGGGFALHTFMAEKNDIILSPCTTNLPSSRDFRGQGGDLMSANYNRVLDTSGNIFSGNKVKEPTYIDEDAIYSGGSGGGFIECTSLNISYDVLGLVTITYTVVSESAGFNVRGTIQAGGQTFTGWVTSATVNQIPFTSWYETHVTMITTTADSY